MAIGGRIRAVDNWRLARPDRVRTALTPAGTGVHHPENRRIARCQKPWKTADIVTR